MTAPFSQLSKRLPKALQGDRLISLLVITPSIIAVAIFVYGFIIWTFRLSFSNWNGWTPDYSWAGLDKWIALIPDERFLIDLRNLLQYAVVFMTLCVGVGFLLAVLLNQRIKGEAIFRTIFIFPFAVSGIVTGVAWKWLMYPSAGINMIFKAVGLTMLSDFQWYANPDIGTYSIALAAAWQMTGYIMALYLAGLRGINVELIEAAQIDGCNTWGLYRHIIIPLLSSVTFTAIVLTGMGSIRVFDLVSAISGSGAAYGTDTLAFNMFQLSFQKNDFATGSAIAAFMIILSAFLVVPYLASLRQETEK